MLSRSRRVQHSYYEDNPIIFVDKVRYSGHYNGVIFFWQSGPKDHTPLTGKYPGPRKMLPPHAPLRLQEYPPTRNIYCIPYWPYAFPQGDSTSKID